MVAALDKGFLELAVILLGMADNWISKGIVIGTDSE
jgi:hypothetical protein